MQQIIRKLGAGLFLIMNLSSCGQIASSDHRSDKKSQIVPVSMGVYQVMTNEICDCIVTTMRNSKPSTTMDSCYNLVISKYTDTLKTMGFDPSTTEGKNMLLNGITIYRCGDVYELTLKENAEEEAKKLLFKGEFFSQVKTTAGEYEITLKENKTGQHKTFKSVRPFDEGAIKQLLPGYVLTIEYEIIRNKKSKKDEVYLKKVISTIGAVLESNQK